VSAYGITQTHTRIHPHTSKNSSDFGYYKIKIQLQKYFSDIVYNVKIKIGFAKNRWGGTPVPLDPPLDYRSSKDSFTFQLHLFYATASPWETFEAKNYKFSPS